MKLMTKAVAVSAAVLLAGSLTACRGSDANTNTDASGIKTDFGVTTEPCPNAIDQTKGCIYLGTLSDLTVGPFKPLAIPITEAQKAFWDRVNKAGGIGGYEVDATTYVRDNKYDPQVTTQVYQEIKPKILAVAQTLGSPQTNAILADLKSSYIVAAPAAWTSGFAFDDIILESGANYCVEAMNATDFAKTTARPTIKSAMAVHYPGDYGDDAANGVKYAASKLGLTFSDVPTGSGADKQAGAISQILTEKPDYVFLSVGPTETAVIVGQVGAQAATSGYAPLFIGSSPTWNPALLASAAAPALQALYLQAGPWGPWDSDTPGHKAMREALGTPATINDGYTAGWVWSYPIKAALEKAVANKDLTRQGVFNAAKSLTSVDYEGMLPAGAGNFAGGAAGQVKSTLISKPDKDKPSGVTVIAEATVGPTAAGFTLTKPCFEGLSV
jgi:ABC-type branched-subunit amino acid transport system substrate-binding protein